MPHGIEVDANNNIWVTDVGLHQVNICRTLILNTAK